MINSNTIRIAFNETLNQSEEYKLNNNSLKSSLFVQRVGEEILTMYDHSEFSLSCQKVDLINQNKEKGEWLLDAVISRKIDVEEVAMNGALKIYSMIINIEWAIESESATRLKDFLDDFSKLININSTNKLYLNGYSSIDKKSFEKYRETRLSTASKLIEKYDSHGNYYFCFWPSPKKQGGSSFWNRISKEKNICNEILTLYGWNKKKKLFEVV